MANLDVGLYLGEELGSYGFPDGHPFGPDRLQAFADEARRRELDRKTRVLGPRQAVREELERFHTPAYVDLVQGLSRKGRGLLDMGDTPAFPGCYEAASSVVGAVLDAVERMMAGELRRAFVPIAGLHHARRDRAGGFCIFNDCAIAIETLLQQHKLERVAYVDIDAHHGDGVYYGFEANPALYIADIHEDGRFLYPGTGFAHEIGTGEAQGTKINIPLPPGADDALFHEVWPGLEAFIEQARPQFVLMQCGADSVEGDPITHLGYTAAVHAHVTRAMVRIAEDHAEGRVLATGGGGYDRRSLAVTWCGVVEALLGA
jgi:acetoin utilization protein AcuC